MFKKLVSNDFWNVSNIFNVEVLQLLFFKYVISFHILYTTQTIFILHLENLQFDDKYFNFLMYSIWSHTFTNIHLG